MSTSRERVIQALNHQQPDRVPLDLGSTSVTGIAASALYQLRTALTLEDRPIRVHEPYQMLGQVDEDLLDTLGVDIIGLGDNATFFGFPANNWKAWQLGDGTPVQVPGRFNTIPEPDGTLFQYPQGNQAYGPSARMPSGGYYFDAIERQQPYTEESLDPAEWVKDMASILTDEDLGRIQERAIWLFNNSSRAIIANFPGATLGGIARVPAMHVPAPKGIRAVADWYMATVLYPSYIHGIFEQQTEIALKNLALYQQAVGERVVAVFISGTDFGAQTGAFISPDAYRQMFQPYHKRINDWVHANTSWKTFYHTCGSMVTLFDDLVDAGVDIVNPVQISAAGMDPAGLKQRWGTKLVFWGGGVDTQHVLPFGTPDEIRDHIEENIRVFSQGGGFVFNTVHNIQAKIPIENLLALFEAYAQAR